MKSNWNRDHLKGYMLLYCANTDLRLSQQEIEFIRSRVKNFDLEHIREEFEKDSDYESLEKIKAAYEELGYSDQERRQLLNEIKELFNSDGEFDQVERYIQNSLNRLLS